jgi:dTDP-4-amino-4,6-dideoxygalactose transaminase
MARFEVTKEGVPAESGMLEGLSSDDPVSASAPVRDSAPPLRIFRPYKARETFLPFFSPSIGEEEIAEVVDTLRSDWITTGPKTLRFEEEFCRRFDAPGALGLNSCTAGLHTSLLTLGIGPGDEVITTPMTFAASVSVIEHVGATPVLADVEPDTLNIDPARIEAAITSKTKAVLPVHYAGHPAELDSIRTLALAYGLFIIEDAAHAISAKYRGRWIGSGPDPVSFSFYATKNITTAEGGMLTGDPDFLAKAKVISMHGLSRDAWNRYGYKGSWYYEVTVPGFKYNMSDVQASLGLVQLRNLTAAQLRRRQIVQMYAEAFASLPCFELPVERPDVEHAWHLYVLRLQEGALRIGRDQFVAELKERNIGTSVHFVPIHLHPFYRDKYGWAPEAFPVAYDNYRRMLSLPLHLRLSDEDVDDVIATVLDLAETFQS